MQCRPGGGVYACQPSGRHKGGGVRSSRHSVGLLCRVFHLMKIPAFPEELLRRMQELNLKRRATWQGFEAHIPQWRLVPGRAGKQTVTALTFFSSFSFRALLRELCSACDPSLPYCSLLNHGHAVSDRSVDRVRHRDLRPAPPLFCALEGRRLQGLAMGRLFCTHRPRVLDRTYLSPMNIPSSAAQLMLTSTSRPAGGALHA